MKRCDNCGVKIHDGRLYYDYLFCESCYDEESKQVIRPVDQLDDLDYAQEV